MNILGLVANITSLVLWIPQAKITYQNRHNREALKVISYGTQTIASANTILWGVYGILIHSIWLAMGTIFILPLTLWTIWLKHKAENDIWFEQNSRTVASENELIESEYATGYFKLYMGNMTACDHQGQQTLVKLESDYKIADFCRKYKIDVVQFNGYHWDEKSR